MTQTHDFASRSHSLWRMRMAQFQQRFGFFSKLILACTGAGSIIWAQFTLPSWAWTAAAQCLGAKLLQVFAEIARQDIKMNVAVDGERLTVPARVVATHPLFAGPFDAATTALLVGALMGLVFGVLTVWLIQRTMKTQGKDTLADRVLGGTRLVGQDLLAVRVADRAEPRSLAIGSVPIPRGIETRHFAFLGTTGSGKTTALRQMLDRIEARGEAALGGVDKFSEAFLRSRA